MTADTAGATYQRLQGGKRCAEDEMNVVPT